MSKAVSRSINVPALHMKVLEQLGEGGGDSLLHVIENVTKPFLAGMSQNDLAKALAAWVRANKAGPNLDPTFHSWLGRWDEAPSGWHNAAYYWICAAIWVSHHS